MSKMKEQILVHRIRKKKDSKAFDEVYGMYAKGVHRHIVLRIPSKEEAEDFDFEATLEEYNEELQGLNVEAKELEEQINLNVSKLLGVK